MLFVTLMLIHGGGLNAAGCHNDRQRGDYHCHRGSAAGVPDTARATARSPSGGVRTLLGGPFSSCAAARAAGAAPVRRGDPD